jgi:hypothetical protein
MSWLFSQVLVGEYLGDICSDGEQSVQSNGSHTQQAYCLPDKMTEYSRLSRFGMMFKPLTENLGEELLMSYRAGFHAKTLVQREKEQELTESGQECGERWQGLLARLDQSSFLWKTVQCSLLEDSEQSLEIWPNWGSMRNGVCWEQMMWEQTTTENEYGYWLTPTATAISGRSQEAMEYRTKQRESQGHKTVQPGNLAEQVMYSGKIPCKDMKKPTMLPTPTAHNSKEGAYPAEFTRKTPTLATHAGGKLNPMWTEWLMGWPLGWTDLKPLEMDKSHYVQQQLGTSLKED